MKILLVNPPLRSITNRFGVGFQLPLGLVMIGGPLADAGHEVTLLDADARGLKTGEIVEFADDGQFDAVLVGHSGSTPSNPASLEIFRAVKTRHSRVKTVYGGVYPSYAADTLLRTSKAIDIVVRGEGEATVVELLEALSEEQRDLSTVRGISWRDGSGLAIHNVDRPAISNLDYFRVGWELVDWNLYRAFGAPGAAAGIQFSRGCPRSCTYCGQWGFWKRWRHRSVSVFADDVQLLHDAYGVRALWIADENWGDDPSLLRQVLEELATRRLGMSIYCSMCASDVQRDLDLLCLYREAGIRFILMGVETSDAAVLQSIHKDNPHEMVKLVVRALRENGIISIVNYIFGIVSETHRSMHKSLRHLIDLDADFVNALYLTPHGWTVEGRKIQADRIVQVDQTRWSYRNQVMDAGDLNPWQLFLWVKVIELVTHIRPRWFCRMFNHQFPDIKKLLRWCSLRVTSVWLAEVFDQILHVRYRSPGQLEATLKVSLIPDGVHHSVLKTQISKPKTSKSNRLAQVLKTS